MVDISAIRLINQQITATGFKSINDLVGWMGAMQAQDYAMVKWAIGVRLPDSTVQAVETAINNGEIVRTHLLRPTWHLVSAEDIYWILDLTAPQIKASVKSRHKELELSEAIARKSNRVIEQALRDGNHLTRAELIAELAKNGIPTNNNRASHLLVCAELDGIVCSGASKAGNQTYALLESRISKPTAISRAEALANLAKRYFTSHGPATLQDFVWWSGLSGGDGKQALELVKSNFISDTLGSQTYWFTNSYSIPKTDTESVHLLPAYDEFMISYKDRSASLHVENQNHTISNNGIFRPVIVIDGQVVGIWKRTIKKDRVIVETEFFKQPLKTTMGQIERAADKYGNFLEKKTELIAD